jgi:hypothetical protein
MAAGIFVCGCQVGKRRGATAGFIPLTLVSMTASHMQAFAAENDDRCQIASQWFWGPDSPTSANITATTLPVVPKVKSHCRRPTPGSAVATLE